MCMRCDGHGWDEIERHTDLVIRVHGYLLQQVEAARPWTYTIGCRESWGRPELLIVDVAVDVQAIVLKAVADDYVAFGDIRSDTLDLLDVDLAVVDAHHFDDGLVAGWEGRYARAARTGDFLQVVLGPSWFCDDHQRLVRRLDGPAAA